MVLAGPGKPYVACMDGPPVLSGYLGGPRMHLRAGSRGSTLRDSSSKVALQGSRDDYLSITDEECLGKLSRQVLQEDFAQATVLLSTGSS